MRAQDKRHHPQPGVSAIAGVFAGAAGAAQRQLIFGRCAVPKRQTGIAAVAHRTDRYRLPASREIWENAAACSPFD